MTIDQRKTSYASDDFPGNCQTSHIHVMTIPWEWGFEESSKLPIPVDARLSVFKATVTVRLLVFKITLERGRGEWLTG